MKKAILALSACLLAMPIVAFVFESFNAQRADYGWSPVIARRAWSTDRPRVLFDEGHHNSSIAFTSRFWPFARLLRADGYRVERNTGRFTREILEGVDILAIVNASGTAKREVFGINMPGRTSGSRGDPAFHDDEIELVEAWVRDGGSLFFVADHAPFGEAASGLAAAFNVTMHKGFVEVPGELSDPLLFSAENGRLGDHPILRGDGVSAAVRRVMTYTGQSLEGPPGSVELLRLPDTAIEYLPGEGSMREEPAGPAQAVVFEHGAGRVAVLGEGGMATAQVHRRVRYGINVDDNDNARFVLNVMRWLANGGHTRGRRLSRCRGRMGPPRLTECARAARSRTFR